MTREFVEIGGLAFAPSSVRELLLDSGPPIALPRGIAQPSRNLVEV
jgi:hypothetical protein